MMLGGNLLGLTEAQRKGMQKVLSSTIVGVLVCPFRRVEYLAAFLAVMKSRAALHNNTELIGRFLCILRNHIPHKHAILVCRLVRK